MAQAARCLVAPAGGFLRGHRFVLCDRDSKSSAEFKAILGNAGVDVILTPKQAPNCNAYAERLVLSIKSECLRRMIFFGELSLRWTIREYVAHYRAERAHQGVGNVRLDGSREGVRPAPVVCHERVGGILESYSRAAWLLASEAQCLDGGHPSSFRASGWRGHDPATNRV